MKVKIYLKSIIISSLLFSCTDLRIGPEPYDGKLSYNSSTDNIELEIGPYNNGSPAQNLTSDWYEIKKDRDQSLNTLYYLYDLVPSGNQWIYQPDVLRYTYFPYGSRWFQVTGQYTVPGGNIKLFDTPDGRESFRLSITPSLGHAYLDTAGTRYNVPYIFGNGHDQFGHPAGKIHNNGFNAVDCSGLVAWVLLKNNINLYVNGTNDVEIVDNSYVHLLHTKFEENYIVNIPVGSLIDGNIVFLDLDIGNTGDLEGNDQIPGDGIADHIMFWTEYDLTQINGWVLHARGRSTRHSTTDPGNERGKVVFQPMTDYYVSKYFNGALVY